MRRLSRFWTQMDSQRRCNCLAVFIAIGAISLLRLEAAPIPAGSESFHRPLAKAPVIKFPAQALAAQAPSAENTAAEEAAAAPLSPEAAARQTLERKMAIVQAGIQFLEKSTDYTAQFMKQELVSDELTDEQDIFLKVRHQPLSLYLKWLSGERGREVLYVDGQNDGEMLVRSGGWKARLPTMSISPDGTLAMREARYPVTKVGLLELARMVMNFHQQDLETTNYTRCDQLEDQEFDGRVCSCFYIEYKDAASSPNYRKSLTLIDKEWSIPVYIKNYGWPTPDMGAVAEEALDEATLIEYYRYSEIRFGLQLADKDFDRENEEYRLH